jgi:hypothetical protein
MEKMQSDADAYLHKTGPRDMEWERQFIAEFLSTAKQAEEISAAKFELDTLHSVVHGDLPQYWDMKTADSTRAVWQVVRLHGKSIASKDGLLEETATVESVKDVGAVKDVTAESTGPQTAAVATRTPTPVVKSEEKKSGEDKTVEKGKEESGVEDS